MKIEFPKFLLYVMMTSATAVAADSSSTLATKVTIEEEKSLLNNEERATTTTTTTTPEGFAASSLLSSSSSLSLSSSLVDANAVVVDRTSKNNGDSGNRFSPNGIDNLRVVVDPVNRGDGSSSKTGPIHHTVADAVVSDILLETIPVDSGGRFSPSDISNNNLHHAVVDPVTRGDGSSSKTSTMHHMVVDAGVSDVLLETDSGGRFFPSSIVNRHAVVDAINDDDEISSFTGTDSSDVSAQRKLIKSSKKVKHTEALCTLSLFADSLFMYANRCFTDIMVTISPCDDKDDMCYISEHYPSLRQAGQENQEEEQCFVGGSFPAKQNIRYNPLTGDCEFLYVDLIDDPCESYTGDTGTGSLGLKARINMHNSPDVMFIQFTKDKGLTFYNKFYERVAKRSTNHNDRYLRQEEATKPVLSMMPHPFASGHRQLFVYNRVSVKNDTPYEVMSITVEYCGCNSDENTFITSGGTWTASDYRGSCLLTQIHTTLRLHDGTVRDCLSYISSGTTYAKFFVMWIDGTCCHRSTELPTHKCTAMSVGYNHDCHPNEKDYKHKKFCNKDGTKVDSNGDSVVSCATDMWRDGCKACMCYNPGNAAWCDGFEGHYYDNYFRTHGENPWGDDKWENRKCNTDPLPATPTHDR